MTVDLRRGSERYARDGGYSVEVDRVDEGAWYELMAEFADASIYQTWAYGLARDGRDKMSDLVVRKHGEVVAIAQSRLAKIPLLNAGIAYVMWGPLYPGKDRPVDISALRQTLRALRNEYVCERGLLLSLYPRLLDEDRAQYLPILKSEGFSRRSATGSSSTIIMDLEPPLGELRGQLGQHWRRELRNAEKKSVSVLEGDSDELFADFIVIYREMFARKGFRVPSDINEFHMLQRLLPRELKMKLMLRTSAQGHCSGVVASTIGDTALYLFGATSRVGMKVGGSYLLQWRLLAQLKESGIRRYDLHGINPPDQPGRL